MGRGKDCYLNYRGRRFDLILGRGRAPWTEYAGDGVCCYVLALEDGGIFAAQGKVSLYDIVL